MKYLNFKLLIFFAALALASPPAWAGTVTDFIETFNDCAGSGGNDDKWSGSIGSSTVYTDNEGWTLTSAGGASECMKLGTSNKQGSAQTPTISVVSGRTYTLTFRAGAWDGDANTLKISCTGGALNKYSVAIDNGSWSSYTITFVANSNAATIKFTGYQASKARFFLDDVVLSHEESGNEPAQVATPTFNPEAGTFDEPQPVTISCATSGAAIYYTTDGSTPDEDSEYYSGPIYVEETTTIKAIAFRDDMTPSAVAEAQYTINNPSNVTQYRKITSTDKLTPGDYLIVCESANDALNGSLTDEFDVVNNGFSVEIEDGVIGTNNQAFFTLAKINETAYSIKSASGFYIGMDRKAKGIDADAEEPFENTISFDNNGDAVIAGASGYVLRYNAAADQNRFRYYSSGQQPVSLYKKVSDEPEKQDPGLAFAEPSVTVYEGVQDFPEPALTIEADLPVSYESNNTNVATVDEEGNVTIVGVGNATITASVEESTYYTAGYASYNIIVKAKEAAGLSFGVTEPVSATYGAEFTAPTLTNDANLPVTYESSDTTVVKVDAQGNVTIVGAGNATITATTQGDETHAGGSASYVINVAKANATMSFSPNAVTIVEGQEFTAPTLTNEAGLDVSYESNNTGVATVDDEGNVTIEGVGSAIITATGAANGNYNGTSASYTITVNPKPVVAAPTFTPAAGYYNSAQNVTIACETAGADIYYTIDGTDPTTESTKYTAAIPVGENMTIKAIAVKEGYTSSSIAVADYVIDLPVQIAAPTFMPGSGHYTEAKEVAIACATPGASILYKIGNGEFQPYTKPFVVDQSCTVTAKVTMEGKTVWSDNQASATYTINTLDPVKITDGYYQIKNNGNDKYANVQGRKTMNFTNDIDQQAGTVIRVMTKDDGQVQVLRSQAADLQGYANRAMRYVPEIVQKVVDKLHAEGSGEILGEDGLDAIMNKFDECFDYHLYVEGDLDNCRIYGKTPSMQPVVDFYNENQAKVDDKLPMLVDFINDAIQKVLVKTEGHGASILVPFSLDTIWNRMGGMLIRPVDDESTMAFYHQVLTNKQYVWDFAYQTATFYLEKVQAHPRYEEMKEYLGEFGQYIDKLEQVRPDMKYFIVQNNGKVDYISEGNADIIHNEPWTFWNVEPRSEFKVNFPAENIYGGNYVTTLYTDFAYDLPKSVTAYKVANINESGYAKLEVLDGTIPAQTPVMLVADTIGVKTLTLNIAPNALADTTGNQLHGPDYLINKYEIKTPQVQALFNLAKRIFGDNFYNNNVAQYEHLMLKTAGTVNNRYFWGMTSADLDSCTYLDEEGTQRLEVRSLDSGEQGIGFYNNWTVSNNKAFLANTEFNPIKLSLKGDVNRDGKITIADVTAQINILLALPDKPYIVEYDYEAADFNENGSIMINDVTALINYLLRHSHH